MPVIRCQPETIFTEVLRPHGAAPQIFDLSRPLIVHNVQILRFAQDDNEAKRLSSWA